MVTIKGTITNEANNYIAVRVDGANGNYSEGDRVEVSAPFLDMHSLFINVITEVQNLGESTYVYFNKVKKGF